MLHSTSVRDLLFCGGGLTLAGSLCAFTGLEGCSFPAALLLSLILTAVVCASLLPLRRAKLQCLVPCCIGAAMLLTVRILGFPEETSDFTNFLRPWTEYFRANGHLRAIGHEVGNYNVPYLVLLAFFSYFRLPELYLIKFTSVLFDLLLAVSAAGLVREAGQSDDRSAVSYLLTLLLPTVVINGAVWGQCDSIYVSLGLTGLLLCLKDKPFWGMAAFGISFAFKLQAVFLLPIVLLLLFAKKVKIWHLPAFPLAYVIAVCPAMLGGRSVLNTLLIYVNTASTAGDGLNYNSPSVFSLPCFYWMEDTAGAAKAGILAAFILCVLIFVLFFCCRKRITNRSLIFAALLFACGLPLFLPHMHERYFYLCDVLTLVCACMFPPLSITVLFSQFASLIGYHAYFYMRYLYPMRIGFYVLAVTLLASVVVTGLSLFWPEALERYLPEAESKNRLQP